ncbi:hypothetical protein U14_03723 [Candidatus Moduliflexus flocculans]|uniref:Uncharacterized protein n=1 Tax=Candidatus Moduliflexus flocculans TaxID=1499966 RepID=A0A081BQ06_9BACT|nr:hypothetical protein U14_03723 [Candidatus Moduliflexus flocculans]
MMKSIGAWGLIGVGAFLSLGLAVNLSKGKFDVSDVVVWILFGIAPIIGGVLLLRSRANEKKIALKKQEQSRYALQEKEILRLAQEKGGRLAIPDIVVGTSLSSTEAEAIMREMAARGFADMQVTDAGIIVYEFYEIANRPKLEE